MHDSNVGFLTPCTSPPLVLFHPSSLLTLPPPLSTRYEEFEEAAKDLAPKHDVFFGAVLRRSVAHAFASRTTPPPLPPSREWYYGGLPAVVVTKHFLPVAGGGRANKKARKKARKTSKGKKKGHDTRWHGKWTNCMSNCFEKHCEARHSLIWN